MTDETNDMMSMTKRYAVVAVASLLLLAGCTGGGLDESGADAPVDEQPVDVAPAPTAAPLSAVPVSDDAEELVVLSEMPEYGVRDLVASRADAVVAINIHGADVNVVDLATAPALEIGQDPSEAAEVNGHARLSSGEVMYALVAADGSAQVVVQGLGGDVTVVGSGSSPEVLAGETIAVYLDGGDVVGVAVGTWGEGFRHAVGDDLSSLEVSPDGTQAAVVSGDDVIVVTLADGATRTVGRAAAVAFSSPTWRGVDELAVLQTLRHESGSAEASVLVVDSADRVLDSLPLPQPAVAIDYDASGEWLVFVDAEGALRWLGEGTTGLIDDDVYRSASW